MITKSGYLQLLLLLLFGSLAWFFTPVPQGVSIEGWHLLIIFLLTIIGIILEPTPISVVVLLSTLICIITKTISFNDAFNGFGSSITWIIVFAFFIARGLIKTGLGKRIAYFFITQIGGTTLGLAYGMVITEFLLALIIPSVSARSGGVIYPIIQSIIKEYENGDNKTSSGNNGRFLIQVCFHAATISCAMFVTAMSGNPLIVSIAGQLGTEITWTNWAVGAIVPGIVSLLFLPLLLYVICPPSTKVSHEAPMIAKKALDDMGSLSFHEIIMSITFIGLILLWVIGKDFGIDSTTTAMIGVIVLLLSGVLTWNDLLSEKSAWDIMIWFSLILSISGCLSTLGVMEWLGHLIEQQLSIAHYSKELVLFSIISLYFFVHYFFASVTAHVTVFYAIFVTLLVKLCGIGLLPACLILAYVSSLSGSLTHYGNSAAPIFFGARYFTIMKWWKIGLIVSIANIIIWSICGYFWWRYIELI